MEPTNRFESVRQEADWEQIAADDDFFARRLAIATEYLPDDTQGIVSENDSPDIFFRYSLNPYRGCLHGCSYCYARPSHEYLGMNAGLDFESRIVVKQQAPQLFKEWLARPKWQPEPIMLSGVTDCYQPVERDLKLTRGCLEVAHAARQPMRIITKNALVTRDLDLLSEMAKWNGISVAISVTTLDAELARKLEPRTSTPEARLRAIAQLTAAGIPTSAMTAPIIPGLNDHEIPALLQVVAEAGAINAGYVMLRLPLAVEPIFLDWLEHAVPQQKDRVLSRLRSVRGGRLSSGQFGERLRGTGEIASQINQTFQLFAKKYGLTRSWPELNVAEFRPPTTKSGQKWLF